MNGGGNITYALSLLDDAMDTLEDAEANEANAKAMECINKARVELEAIIE